MNYSDVKKFLNSQITALEFEKLIREEVIEYKHNWLIHKDAPVTLNYIENEYMVVDRHHFKIICDAYLNDFINEFEMYYMADAILMSEHFVFEDEEIEDLFSQITDPEINGEINKEVIKQLLTIY